MFKFPVVSLIAEFLNNQSDIQADITDSSIDAGLEQMNETVDLLNQLQN